MSFFTEMLEAASRGAAALGPSNHLVRRFILDQHHPDGGFKNRAGENDLYYTVFGLGVLAALLPQPTSLSRRLRLLFASFASSKHADFLRKADRALSRTREYVAGLNSPQALDFVHLCSFARIVSVSASSAENGLNAHEQRLLLDALEKHRAGDGGYHPLPDKPRGTAYGAFLALGAYQDLCAVPPDPARLVQSLLELRTVDGGWTNEQVGPIQRGSTNSTAATVLVLQHLGAKIPSSADAWLLRQAHPQGGFRATPEAPIPDLLSTASALHALTMLGVSYSHLKEPCLDFLDSLWTNTGGFHGSWADDHVDCEYTFYGLMALGHLSACE